MTYDDWKTTDTTEGVPPEPKMPQVEVRFPCDCSRDPNCAICGGVGFYRDEIDACEVADSWLETMPSLERDRVLAWRDEQKRWEAIRDKIEF